jgi:hypothetical protein
MAPSLFAARQLVGLFILTCLASSCASSRNKPTVELQTRITEGGLKLFELSTPMQAAPTTLPTGNPRQQRPDNSDRQMQKHLLKTLDEVMEQSGYCREGYVLLGRYAGETARRVRGECRDRATAEDRQKFPDNIERW